MSGIVIGIAVGAGTLVALFGVSLLRGGTKPAAPEPASPAKQEKGMKVQLCRKGIERLGAGREPFLDAIREREHTPIVRECLNRCQECNGGQLLAIVDSMPIGAANPEALLRDLDELSAEED